MLDITALLAPISEELPAGVDLRATDNNAYLQLREARLAARQQQEHEALQRSLLLKICGIGTPSSN